MAKQQEAATEASRIAALEAWPQSTAAFMESVNERLGALEAKIGDADEKADMHEGTVRDVLNRVEALEKAMVDGAHVARATAENAPIDGDVGGRIKRLEQHAGIKTVARTDEAGS